MQIISEETGIAVEDLADDTVFADSGVDSLLSLMITSRFSEELDTDVRIDSSLFTSCDTLKDLKKHLLPDQADMPQPTVTGSIATDSPAPSTDSRSSSAAEVIYASPSSSSDEMSPDGLTPGTSDSEDFLDIQKLSVITRKASSIILQGRPWTAKKMLFLFPDGAGSATSYASLPNIHSDAVAVIGLNCPFVRHPQEMADCSLDALVTAYLDEIKRRQPHGIYYFGGWSAGGILAYRAAQIMIERGEKVDSLVLIDSPVPKGLDRLPQRFYDHCKSIGVFGASPSLAQLPAEQLFAHFRGTIEVLRNYYAKPLAPKQLRKVTIIWAAECVMDGVKFPKLPPGPGDTEGMKFLAEKRKDFSAAGWQAYFPAVEVDVKRIDNAHHFSMLVSRLMSETIQSFHRC